ncbi:tyrosine-type recombinase/integrase [Actinopolymorpha singaporensis]
MLTIFNGHLEIEQWVTSLHDHYEESSVASYFGLFSTILNAAVRARVIPASPCAGIRVTAGAWESDKLVATPVQGVRAAIRLYEAGLGLGGLALCLMNLYTGARWGELAGQLRHEYDEVNKAIGIIEPLKEVNGKLVKAGATVAGGRLALDAGLPGRRVRRAKRGARTKTPAGTRWVRLSPSIAVVYEALLDLRPDADSFVFVSPTGSPWFRSNFRQRYWRAAWDGVNPDDPDARDHLPALLSGFRFHEGRHTHTTWLAQDGVPEIARRARVGHKMPGIARVYEHVTPEMQQQVSEVLEARWLTAALALEEDELAKLLDWVPQLRSAIEAARRGRPVGSGSG